MYCKRPRKPEHASLLSNRDYYMPMDTVTVRCQFGYGYSGSGMMYGPAGDEGTITCQDNGEWDAEPFCHSKYHNSP